MPNTNSNVKETKKMRKKEKFKIIGKGGVVYGKKG